MFYGRQANTSWQRRVESCWCLVQGYLPPLHFAVGLLSLVVVAILENSLLEFDIH